CVRPRASSLFPYTTLFRSAGALLAAMMLYGITSVGWVWVLQRIELGRVYPLMALAFVLVPVASHFVFGERFQTQYFIGVALIMRSEEHTSELQSRENLVCR